MLPVHKRNTQKSCASLHSLGNHMLFSKAWISACEMFWHISPFPTCFWNAAWGDWGLKAGLAAEKGHWSGLGKFPCPHLSVMRRRASVARLKRDFGQETDLTLSQSDCYQKKSRSTTYRGTNTPGSLASTRPMVQTPGGVAFPLRHVLGHVLSGDPVGVPLEEFSDCSFRIWVGGSVESDSSLGVGLVNK